MLRGDIEVLRAGDASGEWLFRVRAPSVLTHEEHERMVLDRGVYRKVNQVEFDPFRERIVQIRD